MVKTVWDLAPPSLGVMVEVQSELLVLPGFPEGQAAVLPHCFCHFFSIDSGSYRNQDWTDESRKRSPSISALECSSRISTGVRVPVPSGVRPACGVLVCSAHAGFSPLSPTAAWGRASPAFWTLAMEPLPHGGRASAWALQGSGLARSLGLCSCADGGPGFSRVVLWGCGADEMG